MTYYANILVKDYNNKKLTQYLEAKDKALILFNTHGIGDVVMFMPLYNKLKQLFPSVTFNLALNQGQQLFQDITESVFDKAFYINFYQFNASTAYSRMSKPQICCNVQLGIPYDQSLQFTWKPEVKSDIKLKQDCIGCAFQVTSNPKKSLSEDKAFQVWNGIKAAGYTPVEIYFQHQLRNIKNTKYDFIDYTMRDFKACPQNLVAAVNQCEMFIGVNTGSLCVSAALHPNTTLALNTRYHWSPNYQRLKPIPQLDNKLITKDIIKAIVKDTLTNKSK